MQRHDATRSKLLFSRFYDRCLQGEGSIRVDVSLGRKIKINVLNIQVDQKGCRIPQRARDFEVRLKARGQLVYFAYVSVTGLACVTDHHDPTYRIRYLWFYAEKLGHTCANNWMSVVIHFLLSSPKGSAD